MALSLAVHGKKPYLCRDNNSMAIGFLVVRRLCLNRITL